MRFTTKQLVEGAKNDLARRLDILPAEVTELRISEAEFSDMSLGTPVEGEVAAQMISNGWRIELGAEGSTYEYRADKYQLRAHNFNGANYVIKM